MKIRFAAAAVAVVALLCACASSTPVPSSAHGDAADAAAAAVDFDALLLRRDHSERLAPGMPIVVDNPYGDVRLRFGGYEHTLELHVTEQRPDASAPGFAYVHAVEAGSYQIRPQLAPAAQLHPKQRTDLVLFVPEGHAVQVTTARGLIESRGLKTGLIVRSEAGNIQLRGTAGSIDAQTDSGTIEVALEDAAPASVQRLVTITGSITVALSDSANVAVTLASSAPLTTEFSLDIERLPGQEPNKQARAEIGKPAAALQIHSKRGEIRLLRRAAFTPVASS